MARLSATNRTTVPQLQNLVKYSNDLTQASWTTDGTSTVATATITDPFGNSSLCSRLTCAGGGSQYVRGNGYVPANTVTTYTISVWAKTVAGGSQTMRLSVQSGLPSGDLTVTGTWTRISYTMSGTNPNSTIVILNNVANGALDVYLYDIQIVRASWPGPECVTGATAVNTGNIRNITANVQNLIPYSQSIASYWSYTGCTLTGNSTDTLDPWGTSTATVIVEDGSTGTHRAQRLGGVPSVIGELQCLSIYVKAGTRSGCYIQNSVTENLYADLSTGTITSYTGGVGRGIVNVGNGWYRIWLAFVSPSSLGNSFYVYSYNGVSVSYTGSNGAKALYITGAQYVKSNWPGVYTPTTATAIDTGNIRQIVSTRLSA